MRRLLAALALVLVVSDATWCVDGCEDSEKSVTSLVPSAATCTFCVVPFAVSAHFDLVPDRAPMQVHAGSLVLQLVTAPPGSIDHPPRLS